MSEPVPAVPDEVTVVREPNRVRDLNPTTIAVAAVVLAVLSQLFGLWSVGAVTVLSVLLAGVAGRLGPFLSAWSRTVLLLSVVIVGMQFIFISGPTEVFRWWIFSGHLEGLLRGITFAGRILGVGTPLVLMVQLVDRRRFVLELERRKVSPKATYVVVAALNLIPEMAKQQHGILDAQRARGIETDANWFVRARAFLPTLIPLIISSILSVEEKALALESRGFTLRGPRTALYTVRDTPLDRRIRLGLWLLLLVAVAGRVVLWLV